MKETTRSFRRRRPAPGLEGLERRALLSVAPAGGVGSGSGPARGADRAAVVSSQDRRLSYTTPAGTHVVVSVYGVGSLAGSTVDPDGALNLVYGGTNAATGIVARVSGGTGLAPLRSVRPANLAVGDLSGIGGTVLDVVNLKNFDLIDGGHINLTPGVHTFFLNSVGRNAEVHLRELAESFTAGSGGVTTSTSNGVTLSFTDDSSGARSLSGMSGTFVAGRNIPAVPVSTGNPAVSGVNPGPPPAPPGIVAVIHHVQGAPQSGLGDAQIFGVDPVANTLIRFDAATGAALQTIPLPGPASASTAVALGRDGGRLVALVGRGTTVLAFDAVTGAPRGQFSVANLAPLGFAAVDGMGSTDTQTVLVDHSAGTGGLAQAVDVTASLASGQAVAVGTPFQPQRQFELSGGLAGVPASEALDATGAAHFDLFQPDLTQFGVLALNATNGQLGEAGRAALLVNGNPQDVGPSGTVRGGPAQALGSVDQAIALVTGVANGANIVSLFGARGLQPQGTIALSDPNRLSDLSESFRPDLVDSALVDIQGNVQSFRANDAEGLVLNDSGNLNLVKIDKASDTVIVGEPFSHAQIPVRSNVTILTTARAVGDRNGVTVVPGLPQVGPLSLP